MAQLKKGNVLSIIFAVIIHIFCFPALGSAQERDWITFPGNFGGSPGVIDVNTSFNKKGVDHKKQFLVMTALQMQNPSKNGLNSKAELPILLKFTNSAKELLTKITAFVYVGNFAHEGVRISYFYVPDTIGLRQKFTLMYAKDYPSYTLGLTMKYEKNWQTYFEFLYPGDKVVNSIRKENQGQ